MRRATIALNAEANAIAALLDGGRLDFYAGDTPTSVDHEPAGLAPLASVPLSFAGPAELGRVVAGPFESTIVDAASRRATWCRARDRAGRSVFDATVGRMGSDEETADVVLSDVVLGGGVELQITRLSYQAMR